MSNLLETLGKNELISKSELEDYFYEVVNKKDVLFDYFADKPYKLVIKSFDKCDKLIHFNKNTNTYYFDLKRFNSRNIKMLKNPFEYNLTLLDYLHTMIADVELRKNIKNGCLYKIEPEVFICLVNEYIDKINAKNQLIRDNYSCIRTFQYNIDVLKVACNDYGLPQTYYDNYVNYSNNIIKQMVNKKGYSKLEEAILYENTPHTTFLDWIELHTYNKKIKNLFGDKVINKYNEAIDSFIRRGYIKISNTFTGKLKSIDYPSLKELKQLSNVSFNDKVNYLLKGYPGEDEEFLQQVPIMNKILFGKRLTKEELEYINGIQKVSITSVCNKLEEEQIQQLIR